MLEAPASRTRGGFARLRRWSGFALAGGAFLVGAPAALATPYYAPVPGSPFSSGVATAPGPVSLSWDAAGTLLAASNYSNGSVSVYTVSPLGVLTLAPGSPFGSVGLGRGVSFRPDGTALATANYSDNSISTYTVAPNGVATLAQTKKVPGLPVGVAFTPNGKFLIDAPTSTGQVAVFAVAANGTMTPALGSPFLVGGASETSVAIDPTGTRVVFADYVQSKVRVFSIDASGTLSLLSGPISTITSGHGSCPTGIAINPAATLVATADCSGWDTTFSLAPSGTLTLLNAYAEPNAPRELDFSPGGTLLATGGTSGSTIAVDAVSSLGVLTPIAGSPFATGGSPTWDAEFAPASLGNFLATAGASTLNVSVLTPDVTPPTCVISAFLAGPPKQEQITVNDTGSGLASISNVMISNGTVSVAPFTVGTTSPVVVTATKTDQSMGTLFSFDATDRAGNTVHCT